MAMASNPIRTRFAPTPSGLLHQGNALNALLCWLWAKSSGAQLRLRIDDLDRPRVRDAYLADIFHTLNALGLDWNEGPKRMDEVAEHSQIQRVPRYRETLAALVKTGRVYACTCSRKQIRKAQAELGLSTAGPLAYPGTCKNRKLPLDTPDSAWRLDLDGLPDEVWTDGFLGPVSYSPSGEGDPVIRRRDGGMPAYHIASLTDDLDFGINGIVRGEDLLGATVLQRSIARLLDLDAFLNILLAHHPLLLAPDGEKWSKSAGNALAEAQKAKPAELDMGPHADSRADPMASRTDEAWAQRHPWWANASIFQQAADWLNLDWSAKAHDFKRPSGLTEAAQSLLQTGTAMMDKSHREHLLPHVPKSAS